MTEHERIRYREKTRQLCAERGLMISQYGQGWWIHGLGVNLVIADLAFIREHDLAPCQTFDR